MPIRKGPSLSEPGQSRTRWNDPPRLAAATIILTGAALSLWLNLPGHLSYDSVVQLAEGRAGAYSGEHPPVMSWLLGLADAIRPGAAVFVVFDTLLVHGALLAFVLIAPRPGWLTPLAAAAVAALPQVLVYPGIVWKDVLFAGSTSAGFAALAGAATWWDRRFLRWALIVFTLALVTLAALARQNGAVTLPIAAAAFGWIAWRRKAGSKIGCGVVQGFMFLGVSAALTLAAAVGLSTRLDGTPAFTEAWEGLQTYDVVGAVVRDPDLDLGVLKARAPRLEVLIRTVGVKSYSPALIDSIEPLLSQMDAPDDAGPIAAQWTSLILRHPLTYLRERSAAFGWVFFTPNPDDCPMIYTGVDGPAEEMASAGLKPRRTAKDVALADYALAFAATPAFSHIAYGALGLGLLVVLLRRREPADIAVAGLIASALAFTATFALISIACDYRYLYALDVAVVGAGLYVLPSHRRTPAKRLLKARGAA